MTGYTKSETGSLRNLTHLKRLEIDYSNVSVLPDLPEDLESLVLTQSKIGNLGRPLPSKLKELVFCDSSWVHLDGEKGLPASLERLNLCGSRRLMNISSVPDRLIYLNLEGTPITKLPKLGRVLQELDVSNTKIEHLDLQSLPKSLVTLTVSEGQLDSLADLPPKVTALRIVQAEKLWESPPAKN